MRGAALPSSRLFFSWWWLVGGFCHCQMDAVISMSTPTPSAELANSATLRHSCAQAFALVVTHAGWVRLEIFGWVIIVLAGLLLAFILYIRKKISFTTDMFQEGGRGLQENKSIIAVSLLILLFFFAFQVYWIFSALYIATVSEDASGSSLSGASQTLQENISIVGWFFIIGTRLMAAIGA